MSQLNAAGSRAAKPAGLYHYTTDATIPIVLDGGKRGTATPPTVSIGLHYPAANFTNSSAWADQNRDGIADVFLDTNGDGEQNGAEIGWNLPADGDGDTLTLVEELLFGSDPTLSNSDNHGESDWHEAHNMLNPNRASTDRAKLIDRFRFNASTWNTDQAVSPIPPSIQLVDSFEEKGINFTNGSTPVIYSLSELPLDLAVGTVRFWYVPGSPITATDADWRTLIHARGTSGGSTYEWILELQPSTRLISLQSTFGSTLRQNFLGTLPCAMTPGKDAYEFCLSYTSGSTWLCVNEVRVGSLVTAVPGFSVGVGVNQTAVNSLMACSDRRIAFGGRMITTTTFDRPAKGMIDDVEWYNCAMSNPLPFRRETTPWGATRKSRDQRRAGGWASPGANGTSIEINLRRGWEGLISREWGTTNWQPILTSTRPNLVVDSTVTAGKWYEYRLPVESANYGQSIWGYAGSPKPAVSSGPGFAIVVAVESVLLSWEAANGPLHQALDAYILALNTVYGVNNVKRIDTMKRMNDDPNYDGQLDPKEGPVLMFKEGETLNTAYKTDLQDNKTALATAFNLIPGVSSKEKIVVLVGHVTVPLAGDGAEDGHVAPNQTTSTTWQPAHKGAWACDAWYGDTDGNWTDSTNLSSGASCYVYGALRTDWQSRNVPSDGKYDQSTIPPNSSGVVALERSVGRIDFSKMPGFRKTADGTGEAGYKAAELRMTTAYLNKATVYRTNGANTGPTTNIVRTLFGSPLPPKIPCEITFLGLARPAIGASTRQYAGGLPDSAWEDLFVSTGSQPISMWGMHGGFGSHNSVQGSFQEIRNSKQIADWEKKEIVPSPEIWCHSIFTVLTGSFLGDWNHEPEDLFYNGGNASDPIRMGAGNLQKAILSQSKAGLVSMWGSASEGELWINFSRAAAGFPIGVTLADTVSRFPQYTCHLLSIMGDPTLTSK